MVDKRQTQRNRAPFIKRKGLQEREQHSQTIEPTLPPTKRVPLDDGSSRSQNVDNKTSNAAGRRAEY